MEFLAQNFWLLLAAALVSLLLVRVVASLSPSIRRGRRPSRTIRVVGIGGGGGNAIDGMLRANTRGVEFIALNTDAQALARSGAHRKLQIGAAITSGLGAGGDPTIGERAALDDSERITNALSGSEMVFLTAGLGGGTGSGGAPVVASIARGLGALTIGVVTKPFAFEGTRRKTIADQAALRVESNVDTLIVIPNDRVRSLVPEGSSMIEAFRTVDDVLRQGVQGILDVIATPGYINLDFADVRAVMTNGGPAVLGVGRASGEDRAAVAARAAIAGSLLEHRIDGARSVLLNVASSAKVGLDEVTRAAEEVRAHVDPDANLIFGARFDRRLKDDIEVTVVATGFARQQPSNGRRPFDAAVAPKPGTQREPAPAAAAAPEPEPEAEPVRAKTPRRRTRAPALGPEAGRATLAPASPNLDSDELDIPSFLRRHD